MKKTSRTFKRFAAITSASLLAACMVAPMASFAETEGGESTQPTTYKITIENEKANHIYEAYQIFTGNLTEESDGKKILSNINWGVDVTNASDLGDATAKSKLLTEGMTGKQIIETLGITLDNAPVGTSGSQANGEYVISDLAPGYYLIKDKDNTLNGAQYDAYTSYIIKVVGDATASPKSAYPEVEKQVWDDNVAGDKESGSEDGWGETADHEINETFQFKLTAKINADSDLADYSTYKVVFEDTMSKGVVFDKIDSVNVTGYTGEDPVEYTPSTVTTDPTTGVSTFTVTIDNILLYDTNLANGAEIEVIYSAHLSEDAVVTAATGNIVNNNKVVLHYSNNPNATGVGELGKTKEDTVWVATYQILNTKVDGDDNNKPLNGVEFKLQDSDGEAIKFKYNETKNVYYRDDNGSTVLTSVKDGKIDLVGLDVGTYKLVETKELPGYNKCGDTTIVIGATHNEAQDGATANVTLSNPNGNNTITNYKGASLPSTGGIGTTVFYLGGGAMVAVAGIYLISKKRMKNTQE